MAPATAGKATRVRKRHFFLQGKKWNIWEHLVKRSNVFEDFVSYRFASPEKKCPSLIPQLHSLLFHNTFSSLEALQAHKAVLSKVCWQQHKDCSDLKAKSCNLPWWGFINTAPLFSNYEGSPILLPLRIWALNTGHQRIHFGKVNYYALTNYILWLLGDLPK